MTRRDTIVLVRWALAIACAYMALFSEGSSGALGLGPVVLVVFLTSNLAIGRLGDDMVNTPQFTLGVAALDTVLIGASLYSAGQVSVELVVLFLGVLVLAIAGFQLGLIAVVTMGMTAASLLMVWLGGGEPLWRSSMLLRVPFLLTAAVVYAWLAETGSSASAVDGQSQDELAQRLRAQREAIERCHDNAADGMMSAVQAALNDIARLNQEMSATVGRQLRPAEAHRPLTTARSAA